MSAQLVAEAIDASVADTPAPGRAGKPCFIAFASRNVLT